MNTDQINERLANVQERIESLSTQRRELAMTGALAVGTDETAGINLDNLSNWAREMKVLNTQLSQLADLRRELRAMRTELKPCTCNCHPKESNV